MGDALPRPNGPPIHGRAIGVETETRCLVLEPVIASEKILDLPELIRVVDTSPHSHQPAVPSRAVGIQTEVGTAIDQLNKASTGVSYDPQLIGMLFTLPHPHRPPVCCRAVGVEAVVTGIVGPALRHRWRGDQQSRDDQKKSCAHVFLVSLPDGHGFEPLAMDARDHHPQRQDRRLRPGGERRDERGQAQQEGQPFRQL